MAIGCGSNDVVHWQFLYGATPTGDWIRPLRMLSATGIWWCYAVSITGPPLPSNAPAFQSQLHAWRWTKPSKLKTRQTSQWCRCAQSKGCSQKPILNAGGFILLSTFIGHGESSSPQIRHSKSVINWYYATNHCLSVVLSLLNTYPEQLLFEEHAQSSQARISLDRHNYQHSSPRGLIYLH